MVKACFYHAQRPRFCFMPVLIACWVTLLRTSSTKWVRGIKLRQQEFPLSYVKKLFALDDTLQESCFPTLIWFWGLNLFSTLLYILQILFLARDVVAKMATDNVSSVNDFQWIAQLRYYFEEKKIVVRMITTSIDYGYEYLGNSGRLVITPLTDRCYR